MLMYNALSYIYWYIRNVQYTSLGKYIPVVSYSPALQKPFAANWVFSFK